jgi:RNA polymerase sigma-70 factor (ECF subfamily)
MRPPTARLPEPAQPALRSLEELFRSSYAGLVAMASVITDDASDAVQEAFVEAYRRWEQVAGYDDPVSWLRRVAMNKALDRSRRRRTEGRLAPRLVGSEARASEGSSAVRLDVRAAIRRLPERQRLAVVLYYLGDLSIEEVAGVMGVSAGTVKAALHAARRRLQTFLEVEP